jgi:hypothetical protein
MQKIITLISSIFMLLATFSASAAATEQHLTFANNTIHAHFNWTVGPQAESESMMLVSFKTGTDHKPLDIKSKLSVILFMPDMGHGSSPTKVEKVPGTFDYKVSKMYFTMPGKWEVRVTLKNEDGTKETQTFSINI